MTTPRYHLFGIRHHGPGSTRALLRALDQLQPDCILVEGPPDADDSLSWLVHPDMTPPIALLVYAPENPMLSAFYPFAVFSPEYQALRYGLTRNIPTRFFDLPQTHRLAILDAATRGAIPAVWLPPTLDPNAAPPAEPPLEIPLPPARFDPLQMLAEAAGYTDGERWWDDFVESRRGAGGEVFAGIVEAMSALRGSLPPLPDVVEALREATMRTAIRAEIKAGRQRIAVVCGAWHTPALIAVEKTAKSDAALLKKLPKIKVDTAWVPWTYGRLTYASGYGAGIQSPGWYHHLWETETAIPARWLQRVAALLRENGLDASPAQIIDATRLADTLAALRDRPLPGLTELNEAVESVFCAGNPAPMNLIWERLIVGDRLGDVPDALPVVPLQQDLNKEMKRLRLTPQDIAKLNATAERKGRGTPTLTLDLREQTDLDRSRLLHRLDILDIHLGEVVSQRGLGTFKEAWRLDWRPELAVDLIEAGMWGNTVFSAASAYAQGAADSAADLPTLTTLLESVLKADLPDVTAYVITAVQNRAAVTSDMDHLMDALPSLARIARYGDVRGTDQTLAAGVVEGLVARVCIGLPGVCSTLDDEAAAAMYTRLIRTHNAVGMLNRPEQTEAWRGTLRAIADRETSHGLVAGRAVRLLHDDGQMRSEEVGTRISRALNLIAPTAAAAWLEGFLKDSGHILIHDPALYTVIDAWLCGLRPDVFQALLPLIRRIFSTFTPPERQQLAGRAARPGASHAAADSEFDAERGEAALGVVFKLLGLTDETGG